MATSKKLVLVVGAGASKEVSLPTGEQLKHKIAKVLDIQFAHGFERVSGDSYITQAFRLLVQQEDGRQGDINPYLYASWMIRDAMPQAASIDNFIDAHREDIRIAECGKLAIARCILEAEESSTLRIDRSNINNKMNFKALEPTWYNWFFRLLIENCPVQEIAKRLSNISIITFNYDRCIEQYLHAALRNYYGIDAANATEILKSLNIFHPYGSLGELYWPIGSSASNFGSFTDARQLLEVSQKIKTFSEGTDETHSDIVEIRSTMETAKQIAFLGFSFNKQNLDLLFGPKGKTISARRIPIFATGVGLSESNAEVIRAELSDMSGSDLSNIQIRRELTCADLLQEYSRSLEIY